MAYNQIASAGEMEMFARACKRQQDARPNDVFRTLVRADGTSDPGQLIPADPDDPTSVEHRMNGWFMLGYNHPDPEMRCICELPIQHWDERGGFAPIIDKAPF